MAEKLSVYRTSRMKGALRYSLLRLGKLSLGLLALILLSDIIALIMGLTGFSTCEGTGVSANWALTLLLMLVLSCMLAKSGATFLCRFGTSRFTVWLSQIVSLALCMVGVVLGTLLLSLANNYLILALSRHNEHFSILCGYDFAFLPEAYLAQSFRQTMGDFPRLLLDCLEVLCLMYLFACCLRRNKWVTLAVVILGPLLLWVLTLAPVFRQAIDLVQYGSEGEIFIQSLQWVNWIQKAWAFFNDHWRLVQGLAALVSLPLSYLCVRSTPRP